jgi:hypothetical protein
MIPAIQPAYAPRFVLRMIRRAALAAMALVVLDSALAQRPSDRKRAEGPIPTDVPDRLNRPQGSFKDDLKNWVGDTTYDWAVGADMPQGGAPARQVPGRPGYRPRMTPQAWEFHRMYTNQYARTNGRPGFGYNLMRTWMVSQRQWPEAPRMTDERRRTVQDYEERTDHIYDNPDGWFEFDDRIRANTRHATIHGMGMGSHDMPPSRDQALFIERYHNTPPDERSVTAQLTMSTLRTAGIDCRPAEVREQDNEVNRQRAEIDRRRAQRLADREAENEARQSEYDVNQRAFEDMRAQEAIERIKAKLREFREGGEPPSDGSAPAAPRAWADMSDAERREALKANEDAAWAEFSGLVESDPDAAIRILDAYTDQRDAQQAQRGQEGHDLAAAGAAVADASTAGDRQAQDARVLVNQAGQQAQDARAATASTTAQADAKGSLGSQVGDAVAEGVAEGGKAAGTALGDAAAQKAGQRIFKGREDRGRDDSDATAGADAEDASPPAGSATAGRSDGRAPASSTRGGARPPSSQGSSAGRSPGRSPPSGGGRSGDGGAPSAADIQTAYRAGHEWGRHVVNTQMGSDIVQVGTRSRYRSYAHPALREAFRRGFADGSSGSAATPPAAPATPPASTASSPPTTGTGSTTPPAAPGEQRKWHLYCGRCKHYPTQQQPPGPGDTVLYWLVCPKCGWKIGMSRGY